jgi:lipopolysaccharide/colanic/teichoic acid biosynthesis glycosyltransferase
MPTAKRLFDLVAATAGLIALSPVFVIGALCIKLDDGGPVFFRQERIGRGGVPFRIWKFRSMRTDAGSGGPQVTKRGDPRITRVGRYLRASKIDELPQLVNVICGEMSLVGPRPEVARYVALYTPEQRRVLDLTPGITDPASVQFFDEEKILARHADPEQAYVAALMGEKIRINLEYARTADVWTDIGVIIRTLGAIAGR